VFKAKLLPQAPFFSKNIRPQYLRLKNMLVILMNLRLPLILTN
jgi:hypothetical protein